MKRKYDDSITNFKSKKIRDINLFRFRKNGELHGYNPLVFKKIQDLSKEKESTLKLKKLDEQKNRNLNDIINDRKKLDAIEKLILNINYPDKTATISFNFKNNQFLFDKKDYT